MTIARGVSATTLRRWSRIAGRLQPVKGRSLCLRRLRMCGCPLSPHAPYTRCHMPGTASRRPRARLPQMFLNRCVGVSAIDDFHLPPSPLQGPEKRQPRLILHNRSSVVAHETPPANFITKPYGGCRRSSIDNQHWWAERLAELTAPLELRNLLDKVDTLQQLG